MAIWVGIEQRTSPGEIHAKFRFESEYKLIKCFLKAKFHYAI